MSWTPSNQILHNLFFFSFYAGYTPFVMFRPVYFKYIGLPPIWVGLTCGLRFILQTTITPLLIIIAEKFSSRKLMFVLSYIALIGKLMIIFLVLQPKQETCVVKHVDKHKAKIFRTHHVLFKRESMNLKEVNDGHITLNNSSTYKFFHLNSSTDNLTSHKRIFGKQFNDIMNFSIHNINANNRLWDIDPKSRSSESKNVTHSEVYTENIIYSNEKELFRIFICLLVLVVISDAFDATMFTLVEDSCLATKDIEHYRQGQTFGTVGWGIICPCIGIILYIFNQKICGMYIGSFHYVFYFVFGFLTIAFLCGMCLEYPSHCKDVVSKKVQNPSSNFQYSLFNFAISYSGFCNGFLLTFTYWFIDSLSGSAVMMGLTTAGRAVVNILIDIVLVKVIGFTGHQIVVDIVLVCHIITFVIYWSMKWPFLVILAEIFHATAHITIIQTCASFLSKNTPTGSSPKMQGKKFCAEP